MNAKDLDYLRKYLPNSRYEEGVKLLEQQIPVQYIVGNVDFYGNKINVNQNTLIPRFETELLVDKTIKLVKKYFNERVSILDIGTGSGCIAITLSKELDCDIEAVDISKGALSVARENNIVNNTDVKFYQSDVFSNVSGTFDVIISNPPYISFDEEIMDIVYNNEPHIALFADYNGLYFYDKILRECKDYLNDKFIVAFEIGEKQGEAVKRLVCKYLPSANVLVQKDYSDRDRFVFVIGK